MAVASRPRRSARIPLRDKSFAFECDLVLRCDFAKIESRGSTWQSSGWIRSFWVRTDRRSISRSMCMCACMLRQDPRKIAPLFGIQRSRRTLRREETLWHSRLRVLVLRRTCRAMDASFHPISRRQYVSRELRHARHAPRAARKMRGPTTEPVITTSQHSADRGPRERNDIGNIVCSEIVPWQKNGSGVKIKKILFDDLIYILLFFNEVYKFSRVNNPFNNLPITV